MLQMYYLRTDVFSKQEKQFEETAMALACDDIHELTASTTPPGAAAARSILSISERNECRKLLLSAATGKSQLSSKLWSRKRRRKLTAIDDNCRSEKLLFKLQFQQYNRFIGSRHTSDISSTNESVKERQSIRDIVPGDRRLTDDRCSVGQSSLPSISADGLRSRTPPTYSRRGAASHCLSPLAMGRSIRFKRNQTHTEVSQRKRPHLRLLQSRSLESIMSTTR